MSLVQDFKTFLMRGNLVELAVAFVMGAVFAALLKAFIGDLITPIIALVFGQPDFSALSFTINGSHFLYGDFLNALFTFLTTAAVIFFFVVRPYNALMARRSKEDPDDQAVPGMHERRPAGGTALSVLHVADRRSDRRGSYSASGLTEITRPRRPVVNCTVPAERA